MSPKLGTLNNSAVVVFSDLDGSLLDHHNYSYAPAQPGIRRLQEQDIPLVLATSKTRDEVLVFVNELGLDTPFIIENGGGILVPADYFEVSGDLTDSYEELVLSTPVSELQGVLDHFIDIRDLKIGGILAGSRILQQVVQYFLYAVDLFNDQVNFFPHRIKRSTHLLNQYIKITQDHLRRIIDLMRHPGGKLT